MAEKIPQFDVDDLAIDPEGRIVIIDNSLRERLRKILIDAGRFGEMAADSNTAICSCPININQCKKDSLEDLVAPIVVPEVKLPTKR